MEIKTLVVGPLFTNCFLLISQRTAIVIDPGGGLKRILKEIEKKKTRLKFIILTHHHWDHTRKAQELREKTGAKILVHRIEKDFLKFKPDELLEDGDKIKIGKNILKVLHTPGHTLGSICLVGQDFIFVGDTIFKNGYGRTDLPGGSQKDLEKSLEKLSKFLKPGVKIYPGHGEIFKYSNQGIEIFNKL